MHIGAVGEDGDILNLGEKKKKKKKKQTTDIVVRPEEHTGLIAQVLPKSDSEVAFCDRKMRLRRQQLEVRRKQTSFLS